MPENTELNITRILLAFDAWGCSPASLQRALSLAAQIKAQIHGLYIEDSDLLQMAELPFTREVSFSTARSRNLNSATLNRNLRQLANEMRLMLEEQAKPAAIYTTFRIIRGKRLPIILQESDQANLVILPGSVSWRSPQQQHEHAGVVAIFNHRQLDQHVLDIAVSLAQKEHTQLVLLCSSAESREQAEKQMASTDPGCRIHNYKDLQQLLAQLQQIKPRAIVIARDNPLIADAGNIQMLSQYFKCDLFISRSDP
jgi:hypothetical protein